MELTRLENHSRISRMDKSALARECARLDRKSEQTMADEGLATEISISDEPNPKKWNWPSRD